MTVGGKLYTLEEFKKVFFIGDVIEFYYPDSGGDENHRIFGIIKGFREPGEKYRDGGVDFYYYRLGCYEDLSNLRCGDIGMDEINDPHSIDSSLLFINI